MHKMTYSEKTAKPKTKSTIDKAIYYIFYALVIILCIYLVYNLINKVKINGETYPQRMVRRYYDNLHGDTYDEDAKNVIEYGENLERPRAIDHYRIGTAYLLTANNPVRAFEHFNNALLQIINGETEMKQAPFIIDRIEDFNQLFEALAGEGELPIQLALMAQFEAKNERSAMKKEKVDKTDPDFAKKTLLNQQDWISDSQNVHDASLLSELTKQLNIVIADNNKIPNISTKTYADAVLWLNNRYKEQPEKLSNINKTINYINNNYPIANTDFHEKDILLAVWQRSFDPENITNIYKIRDALGESLNECVEGGCVVCITGRTAKVWQSLALLDKNPEIGILKSKQIIRNEIYQKCAKIVDDYLSNINKNLRDEYTNGIENDDVLGLKKCIRKDIDNLKDEYSKFLSKEQLDIIIAECKDVI